ncbi:hypothetical protein BJ875DRAFT_56511 [Amylocarpus encephaloides]|uniref:DUF2415 domain-containing protein n=1 Tax=Amylocarpus encephaloides TaxID=45428 RepID=A0A9P8C9C9_9HELO|nr:hypothetical protein BJ875DRAFT_56511 [Amylocarpus encephaloides]
MLQNPLNPPYEHSTATSHDPDHAARLDPVGNPPPANAFVNTPTGAISFDERTGIEQDVGTDLSDEDQDMSDGGAPLPVTLTHAAGLSAEPSQLDDNLDSLLEQSAFGLPSQHTAPLPTETTESPENVEGDGMEVDFLPLVPEPASLLVAMSEVSQQLQHIHDGLTHEDPSILVNGQTATFSPNISIPPLPLQSTSPFGTPTIPHPFISTAPGAPFAVQALTGFDSPNDLQTEGNGDATISGVGTMAPQTQIPPSLLPFVADVVENGSDADQSEVGDQFNMCLSDFLYNWSLSRPHQDERNRRQCPYMPAVYAQRAAPLEPCLPSDLQGDYCDIQRIDWARIGVSRREAQEMRGQTYTNYINVPSRSQPSPRRHVKLLDQENYFRFRRMDFNHSIRLTHFQLRNVMACASRGHVFYAGSSKIWQWNPSSTKNSVTPSSIAMDLTNPTVQPYHAGPGGIQVSTLATAHDVLVAGGFCGEYAMINLRTHKDAKHTEGLLTDELNSITNHVQIHLQRGSSLPVAAFSSNDHGFRVLDVNTNQLLSANFYEHALNCTAISPDQRLRVCVGDARDVMITNSETGEILQKLDGHRDFGFACDWADDGWTVATGNQDMQVKIWDARKWTSPTGAACPLTTIVADIAGVRKLKFSPVGSGKRILVAAEPADIVSVIDAQTFSTKQTLSFFGEIGGVDFANDGQDLFVANSDTMRGGIIQYERCGLAEVGRPRFSMQQRHNRDGGRRGSTSGGFDWISDEDEIVAHPKSRGTATYRKRKAAGLGVSIGHF